jgi:hypothetical protein
MIAGMNRENKPKTRWKTISIRGRLLLVFAIALCLGWIVNKAREQREAVAAIRKFGGIVHYDWGFVNGPVQVPRGNLIWKPSWGKFTPKAKPWVPCWVRRALGDEYFQSIAHVSIMSHVSPHVESENAFISLADSWRSIRKSPESFLNIFTADSPVRTREDLPAIGITLVCVCEHEPVEVDDRAPRLDDADSPLHLCCVPRQNHCLRRGDAPLDRPLNHHRAGADDQETEHRRDDESKAGQAFSRSCKGSHRVPAEDERRDKWRETENANHQEQSEDTEGQESQSDKCRE